MDEWLRLHWLEAATLAVAVIVGIPTLLVCIYAMKAARKSVGFHEKDRRESRALLEIRRELANLAGFAYHEGEDRVVLAMYITVSNAGPQYFSTRIESCTANGVMCKPEFPKQLGVGPDGDRSGFYIDRLDPRHIFPMSCAIDGGYREISGWLAFEMTSAQAGVDAHSDRCHVTLEIRGTWESYAVAEFDVTRISGYQALIHPYDYEKHPFLWHSSSPPKSSNSL